ncbi:unnamed protein product [Darwinula stevensoni]|uniref:Transmembrane protein n=1 Tax=Darwinula stevensoni TaxID=69355 RepID=A0A7R9A714_9CRUS|nr:unnamed protein product [Darwinula stevensoni]CAG0891062.1 unnamed protein product [Darwinula stevensoni]
MASTCVLVTVTVLYWAAFLVGFFVFIPLLLARNEYDIVLHHPEGHESPGCMLFVTVAGNSYEQKGSNRNICHTAVFLPLAVIGISALLGSYFTYKSWKVVTSLNKDISYKTSVWPFLLLNILVTIVLGVCAAVTSAGFVETCTQIRRHLMGEELSIYEYDQDRWKTYTYDHERWDNTDPAWNRNREEWEERERLENRRQWDLQRHRVKQQRNPYEYQPSERVGYRIQDLNCFDHVRYTANRQLDLTALIYISVFMYWCEFLLWLVLVVLQVVRLRLRARQKRHLREKELSQFTPLEETVVRESFL